MSLAVKATRSAAWMFAGAITTRIVALAGTLLVVRHVSPGEYGEAIVAAIVVGTASTFSSLGIGQFVIVKAGGRRDLAFHATVYQLVLGVMALGAIALLRNPISAWANTPGIGRYLPPMALSMLLDRLWFVPERTLMREMRFRTVTVARSAGELGYTAVSCATALMGWGGMAIAVGNVARSAIKAAVTVPAVDRRDWLEPCRLRRDATVDLFRFGLPLGVALIASHAANKWDNLIVASFFGPALMAAYNLAYNLAGIASGIVAEQLIDVLVPSFALAAGGRRREGLLRGAALLALVSTPLCFGLAAVSQTVVSTLLDARWAQVAPMLAVLSAAATLGPLSLLIAAYLQACGRSGLTMFTRVVTVVAVLGAVATLGRLGPLWTCGAVGIGGLLAILGSAVVIRAVDGTPVHRLLATQLGPLLAAVPMVGAVLGVRWLFSRSGSDVGYANLAVEIAAGGLAYCGAAFVVARGTTREAVALLQAAFLKRRAPVAAPEAALE